MTEEKEKTRTEVLRFRCTPEEKKQLFHWAEQDARTVSSFIRAAAMDRVHMMRTKAGMGELFDFFKAQGLGGLLGDAEFPAPPPAGFSGSAEKE